MHVPSVDVVLVVQGKETYSLVMLSLALLLSVIGYFVSGPGGAYWGYRTEAGLCFHTCSLISGSRCELKYEKPDSTFLLNCDNGQWPARPGLPCLFRCLSVATSLVMGRDREVT